MSAKKADTDELLLRDFIHWVRKRRPVHEDARDAWVSEETLEHVAKGIERFLEGARNPWPQQRGRRQDLDTIWKCYYQSCVVSDVSSEFLAQHSEDGGAFDLVGKRLNLSAKTVAGRVSTAKKLLETAEGKRQYYEWLDQVEQRWWCYHAVCVERRQLKLLEYVGETVGDTLILSRGDLHLTVEEVDLIVDTARELYRDSEGKREYEAWLVKYNQRDEQARAKPLKWRPLPPDHPASIEIEARRKASGLRTGYAKPNSGRRKTVASSK